MRVSKRKRLSANDLEHSFKSFNEKRINDWGMYPIDHNTKDKDKDKEEIIDIDDYLRTPMIQQPMKSFGHFHWLTIEGNRPNIPENYINSNTVISPRMDIDSDINQLILMNELKNKNSNTNANANSNTTGPNNTTNANVNNRNAPYNQKDHSISNHKVIPKLKHIISKELAIFREDFELIFNQEIKRNLLLIDTAISLMRETEVNLVVLQSEAGIVNLLPLILDLLIHTAVNDHFKSEAKVHLLVLLHIKAIIYNKFFFLTPYLSQIINLLLSMILSEGNESVSISIQVKNMAIEILKHLLDKYSTTYPIIINNLIEIFKEHIVPDIRMPMFLTSYGAIKSITILSAKHIKEIIYPKIEDIMKSFKLSITLTHRNKQMSEVEKEMKKEETVHSVSLPPSLPKYSFSLSVTALADPFITSSIFAVGPSLSQAIHPGINPSAHNNMITKSFEKEIINDNITNVLINNSHSNKTSSTHNGAMDNTWEIINHKSAYVYYALVESVKILLSAYYEDKDLVDYLNDLFGEVLLNYRKDNTELHMMV